tara:strand:+ start:368 stop:796 length:429 start_codon:yes stop_codon:yes gene_type:complete
MQLLAFNTLELPGQAVLDAAAREYEAFVGARAQSGLATGSSARLAELFGGAVALLVGVVLLGLGLRRRGMCKGTATRTRPYEWSTMLETLPDAFPDDSKAAAVVHVAMVDQAPAGELIQVPSANVCALVDTDAGEESYNAVD